VNATNTTSSNFVSGGGGKLYTRHIVRDIVTGNGQR
jgi:hypothetical protein